LSPPDSKAAIYRRLARLRREPETVAGKPERQPAPALPTWFRERKQLKSHELGATTPEEPNLAAKAPGEPRDLETFSNARGQSHARILRFPLDWKHGSWPLNWIGDREHDLATLGRDATLERLELSRSIYLDIETTGLSGGAGTIPFMVGLGTFREDHFELWQGFLRGPEDEAALLEEVAQRVAERDSLVSFFGKSFDRHRLEDKMRVHAVVPSFERPHLDLFHPLKRLYRGAYSDTRLATLERALCKVQRIDDLPGSHAPAAWFDYLAGRAHRLEAVFEHNRDDVLSLVTLAAHLCCTSAEKRPDGAALEGVACARARGLAHLHAALRDFEQALVWTSRALERRPDDVHDLKLLRADLLRLSGKHEQALAVYEEVRGEAPETESVNALLQIAKLCEHRLRDYARAKDAAQLAASLAEDYLTGTARRRALNESQRRIERLAMKLARPKKN